MVKTGNWFGNVIIWTLDTWIIFPFWWVIGYVINWFGFWQITLDGALNGLNDWHYLETKFLYKLPWDWSP